MRKALWNRSLWNISLALLVFLFYFPDVYERLVQLDWIRSLFFLSEQEKFPICLPETLIEVWANRGVKLFSGSSNVTLLELCEGTPRVRINGFRKPTVIWIYLPFSSLRVIKSKQKYKLLSTWNKAWLITAVASTPPRMENINQVTSSPHPQLSYK